MRYLLFFSLSLGSLSTVSDSLQCRVGRASSIRSMLGLREEYLTKEVMFVKLMGIYHLLRCCLCTVECVVFFTICVVLYLMSEVVAELAVDAALLPLDLFIRSLCNMNDSEDNHYLKDVIVTPST